MKLWNFLFSERCPKCKETLNTTKSKALYGMIIKTCPNHHYQKEFHPALEAFIERHQVS
ncbi:hypothetical protein PV791_06315 [Priestia filamentosa]|uniref:hypothetical protein n=1 Tax=Priestia filamentosa TaxID=1402861 RepID=UPI0038573C67